MKTILITGSTDGIGLVTAKALLERGHRVLIHGRSEQKVNGVVAELAALAGAERVAGFVADLSDLVAIDSLASDVLAANASLDVLINNAGVFQAPSVVTADGLDLRFVVNTLAPYLLTQKLAPALRPAGRVVNLSSAAQSPVDLKALTGEVAFNDHYAAYAQSKLAITMWTRTLAQDWEGQGPILIAVNPGSLLASKMVKEGFGVPGKDLGIGADILVRAALDEEFAGANGQYFDNDAQRFAPPHADALDDALCRQVVATMERMLDRIGR
ncbi:SDR family NAD(P)-dependent oxidoreductase [Cobetia marina]|uniref:SDR family NAD(P)-dependent oxidoreductase n=1 Tax=Cobetia marina TaxID=28258 RepID=UPI002547E9DB|nr:SDR family NAD(P)-dependent oxidoreductase [Cobetia pacifica]MDI6002382.1 SDR family NAD(P)-dependent oxidoreductase [Cobetia pacifica]